MELHQDFLTHYPLFLVVLLTITAIYNFARDRHVKQKMEQLGIPVWLRWPAVIVELLVLIVYFFGNPFVAVLIAFGLILGSLLLCLFTGWYRRLWLSVPLFLLTAYWLYQV